jgi:hypothetical protein
MSERAACGLSNLDGNVPIKSKKKNQATGKSNIGQNTLQLGFFRGFFVFHLRVSFISPNFFVPLYVHQFFFFLVSQFHYNDLGEKERELGATPGSLQSSRPTPFSLFDCWNSKNLDRNGIPFALHIYE